MANETIIQETLLGPAALIDIALPTGLDGGEILRFQLQDGTTAQSVIALAAQVIGEVNRDLDDSYNGLWMRTRNQYSWYRQGDGTRTMTPVEGEFSPADGVRGNQIGGMLPLRDYEDAVGWSRRYLERANMEMVRNHLLEIADRWRNRVDYDVLTRVFTTTENLIGTAGYDVPWAIGTGTNVNYIPPAYRGYSFTSSHTHFKYANSVVNAAAIAAMLNTLADDIRHHGYTGRLVALVSDADMALFTTAMTGFVPMTPFTVSPGSTGYQFTAGEVTGIPGSLFGYFNGTRGVIELRSHERIPTGYMVVFKSFGNNNPRNPLAVRVEDDRGFGLVPEPQVDRTLTPKMDKLLFHATHGIGINDRSAAAVGYIASGASAYVAPTIS